MIIEPIGYIRSDFPEKFGLPRQSGMTELVSVIKFNKEYDETAFKGLDGFDYVWLLWGFDRAEKIKGLTVRPPRLGGNKRVGVFSSRSPYRPNPIGLSSVKLIELRKTAEGVEMVVAGADLADKTPIYDVKPYLPYTDSHPDVRGGFADDGTKHVLNVDIAEEILEIVTEEKRKDLVKILSFDPRPSYQDDDRTYGFIFADMEIKFSVKNNTLTVSEIIKK